MDIQKDTYLWKYISKGQKDLLEQGQYLLEDVIKHGKYNFTDYSFLVFPFAKAYEGFLKQIFFDVGFISHLDYVSDHFRLGKVLSANLVQKLGERSVYHKIVAHSGAELAENIWTTWKKCRNEVFHYFPHNLRSLTIGEAEEIINRIMETMERTVIKLKVDKVKTKLQSFAS